MSTYIQKVNFMTQLNPEMKLSYSDITLGMPRLTWPNLVKLMLLPMPNPIKSSTSYLNSFVRYCSLKNPVVWLVRKFFYFKSRIRFFPDMYNLQKFRGPLLFTYSSKKSKHELIRFSSIPQSPPDSSGLFFNNAAPSLFWLYDYITLQKTRKNWWAISDIFCCKRMKEPTNRQTNWAIFMEHFH